VFLPLTDNTEPVIWLGRELEGDVVLERGGLSRFRPDQEQADFAWTELVQLRNEA